MKIAFEHLGLGAVNSHNVGASSHWRKWGSYILTSRCNDRPNFGLKNKQPQPLSLWCDYAWMIIIIGTNPADKAT